MNVGEEITVNVRPATSTVCASEASSVRCTVIAVYPRFAVLDNGKYRFCAFLDELDRGDVIAI